MKGKEMRVPKEGMKQEEEDGKGTKKQVGTKEGKKDEIRIAKETRKGK